MYRYVMPEIDLYLKLPQHQALSTAVWLLVTLKNIYKLLWFLTILNYCV